VKIPPLTEAKAGIKKLEITRDGPNKQFGFIQLSLHKERDDMLSRIKNFDGLF
jgi:hypothetical protein